MWSRAWRPPDEDLDNGQMNSYGIHIFILDYCKKNCEIHLYLTENTKSTGLQILKGQNFLDNCDKNPKEGM